MALIASGRAPSEGSAHDSPDYKTWSGMNVVIEPLRAAVCNPDKVNGWAALAIIHGPEEVTERLKGNIDTLSVISGLLLSASIPLMVQPPDVIAEKDNITFIKQGTAPTPWIARMSWEPSCRATCTVD